LIKVNPQRAGVIGSHGPTSSFMSSLSSPTLPSVRTSSIIASTAMRSEQRPRKLGRPTKFSPELWEKLCDLLAQGLTFEQACAHMDIHRDTYPAWCRDVYSRCFRGDELNCRPSTRRGNQDVPHEARHR
jgi:hypothetical protein